MLSIKDLTVYYGESCVIPSASLALGEGETLAIMGRNGMGKTTLLKAVIGILQARSGSISVDTQDVTRKKSYERVAAGIGYVPQGRMIFPYLTVEENILTGVECTEDKTIPKYIYETFPVLHDMRRRKGGNLSGGQQQQLAIARALASRPKVLLLDEPTEGIQPSVIKDIARILNKLKSEQRFSMLVSEQVLSFAMEIADRFVIIERGEFVYESPRESVDTGKVLTYLTV